MKNKLGFEKLIDIEIMNKGMGMNWNKVEHNKSEEDKRPAWMRHEIALHHIGGLL